MNTLTIERPGLLSTVQDRGRAGHQRLGVPVSGWMDDWSARLANRLAGNPDGAAVIEVTLTGPVVAFARAGRAAVAGAVFDLRVDGQPMRSPCAFPVREGGRVEFLERRRGTRAYLAVAGGIDVEPVLGSRATDVRSALGGLNGRRLARGDRLTIGASAGGAMAARELPPPPWLGDQWLYVLTVGEDATRRSVAAALLGTTYRLAAASDRTGYRLTPEERLPASAAALTSQPVVAGAIQVPPDGQPVLLMADRQTTGGYLVPAVVATGDLPLAAQLAPGDACAFAPCTPDEALVRAVAREKELDEMAGRVG